VLFGSQARGGARADSDHDVFIVAEGLPEDLLGRTRMVRGALAECLADLPGAVNLHARTPPEFESDLTPLVLDVCVDGICLYGAHYFEPFRRKALAALAESGMIRRHVGRSLFWMFPGGGARNWELTWEGYHELP
ncbi:MAG: nucleotidyltransferase domain-containing protein, partial [Acidobacteria bacterium]|nr:nucleotidyltransferase domain-containing protein [Acidobacteriota bacterium]